MSEYFYNIVIPLKIIVIHFISCKQLEEFETFQNEEMINIYVLENIKQ